MLSNIGILCYFRYYDFGIANLNAALTALGFGEGPVPGAPHCPADRHLVLHVSVDELRIDVYRGDARPMRNS